MEAKYVQSPEYHEAWKVQARDVLARAEFRKRKLTQRVSTMQWAHLLPLASCKQSPRRQRAHSSINWTMKSYGMEGQILFCSTD